MSQQTFVADAFDEAVDTQPLTADVGCCKTPRYGNAAPALPLSSLREPIILDFLCRISRLKQFKLSFGSSAEICLD